MSEELKPCPFCGADAQYFDHGESQEVACSDVGCTYLISELHSKKDAFAKWNRRHVPQSILVPRGEPMPQTVEAWQHWSDLVESKMLEDRDEIARLKQQVNDLRQKLSGRDGFELVPIEPTEAMIQCGANAMKWYDYTDDASYVWNAMVTASQEKQT